MQPLKQAIYSSRTADKFVLRLPDGMRERIQEIARANHRSMNSEMIARLERSIAEETGEEVVPTECDQKMADLLDRSMASRIFQLEKELEEAHAKLRAQGAL
jgi:predicted transcriptional regulator